MPVAFGVVFIGCSSLGVAAGAGAGVSIDEGEG
jgi:hypothetical protein